MPVDLIQLRKHLEDIYQFAERNQEWSEVTFQGKHSPNEIEPNHFIEGDRTYILTVTEKRGSDWYIQNYKNKQEKQWQEHH